MRKYYKNNNNNKKKLNYMKQISIKKKLTQK